MVRYNWMYSKKIIFLIFTMSFVVAWDQQIIAFFQMPYCHRYNGQQNNKRKKTLKILFAVTTFPPYSGTAVLNQITGLIDRGHDVYVYAKNQGNLNWAHPNMEKYDLLNRSFIGELPTDLRSYDIIYCQFGYRGADFTKVLNRRRLKGKLVTCFRGADASKHLKENPHKYDALFKVGDLFLPVCNHFRNRLIAHGCDPRKIIVHHSAIDCNKFAYAERTLTPGQPVHIVTVSRLVSKKGLEDGIAAVAKLAEMFPNIKYSIVGFGDLKDKLQEMIDEFGMSEKIKLIGRLSESGVAEILDDAHIFLLPSVTGENGDQEGIPNAVKEAMACGLPIITTFHSGIPELVQDGISGLLVHEHDVEGLIEKLKYLIEHTEEWPEMGRAGREKVCEEFEMEKVNDRLVKIFYGLLQKQTQYPMASRYDWGDIGYVLGNMLLNMNRR